MFSGLGLGSAALLGWGFNSFNILGRENYYLQGNFAPVKAIITEDGLEVVGNIPKDLSGLYLRNGPNPMSIRNIKKHHWFNGKGMLHGVGLIAVKQFGIEIDQWWEGVMPTHM